MTRNRLSLTILLLILSSLFTACDEIPDPLKVPILLPNTPSGASSNWISVSFTDPNSPTADTRRGGPDVPLAKAIDEARLSVEIAAYSFNLWSIRDALIAAHKRGVTVRMVTESDNMDEPEIQEIKEAGIPILGDRRENLMHNKFVVIDRLEVWTGSMNYTSADAYRHNNNLVRLRSSRLAENYLKEFEEMFTKDLFGPDTLAETPYPGLTVEGTQLEVYFSPDDGTAARLVELIRGARESVYFLAYSFTSNEIGEAILERAGNGVTVAGVFDESQAASNTGTEWDRFLEADLDVRLDGNSSLMHHKVIIIDGETVVTGSYNFSANAEKRNDENTLIIHSSRIASQYMVEFQRVFEEGQR